MMNPVLIHSGEADETLMDEFGERLRELRLRYGLTQADLARESNLGQSTISALETGRQSPWPSTRRALSHAFKLTLAEFDRLTMVGGLTRSGPREPVPPLDVPEGAEPGAPYDLGALPKREGTAITASHDFATAKVMELLEQLGRSEHELGQSRLFFDSFPGGCWMTDEKLRVTLCAGRFFEHLILKIGDVRGFGIGELFELAIENPDPLISIVALHRRALDGLPCRSELRLANTRYLLSIDPIRSGAGTIAGTIGLFVTTDEVQVQRPPKG
jgi:transcriptional regulator with XRE-family HTH domain